MKRQCPFKPGEKLICTDAGQTALKRGQTYYVSDAADLNGSVLVEVREHPDMLFHPTRFKRAQA